MRLAVYVAVYCILLNEQRTNEGRRITNKLYVLYPACTVHLLPAFSDVKTFTGSTKRPQLACKFVE